jgi:hypothetical protein
MVDGFDMKTTRRYDVLVSPDRTPGLDSSIGDLGPLHVPSAVVLRSLLDERVCLDLAEEVLRLSDPLTGELHHEVLAGETTPRLCRVERANDTFAAAAAAADALGPLADRLLGVPAELLKDKVNVKPPGGAGYRCHQDALAYGRFLRVVTFAIALTACTVETGCLWAAPAVDSPLPTDGRGCVTLDHVRALRFAAAPLHPGDALVFTGFAPHYSENNTTTDPRVLLLLTYAPAEPGARTSIRDEYYLWRDGSIGRDRSSLSTIDDFEGSLAPSATRR